MRSGVPGAMDASRHPLAVAPHVGVGLRHDAGVRRRALATARAIGSAFTRGAPATGRRRRTCSTGRRPPSGTRSRPDARRTLRLQRSAVAPAVPVAEGVHRFGVGRPHREAHAAVGQRVRPEELPQATVRSLAEEMTDRDPTSSTDASVRHRRTRRTDCYVRRRARADAVVGVPAARRRRHRRTRRRPGQRHATRRPRRGGVQPAPSRRARRCGGRRRARAARRPRAALAARRRPGRAHGLGQPPAGAAGRRSWATGGPRWCTPTTGWWRGRATR